MEGFRTVFVSGEIYLEALVENDPETRASLIDESGMPGLVAGLDAFANDCGLLGALTAPLFGIRSVATQAAAICSADRPEERAAAANLGHMVENVGNNVGHVQHRQRTHTRED